eukprot:CAMPEP_0201569424 /NCGR_PEP_ID=MMETSP0190_2-20130828/11077_1 /ASSEMBLY_ACC=CAM_ASM_000263 /TAXON_ID=37353 /ORGANISM="Rosalina sp." /LENGTH=1071 /DNA_ID=CAMNT_0047991705 /DNA_START=24 /DNA_END=3239 /DNA_ORIENTATION=-
MAATEMEDEMRQLWNELQIEWNETEIKCSENLPFENSSLLDNLRDLSGDATFKPLIARDLMKSHTDFSPTASQNTWDIEFGEDWQKYDRDGKFNKWCKKIHRSRDYEDLIHRFESTIDHWKLILNLYNDHDDEDENKSSSSKSSWFRPPHFPSTLKMSLEKELDESWSNYYKLSLKQNRKRRFGINFNINRLYSTYYYNLIDAIYFAKCVNWDAAYDPKHSAKTNIPIYWVMAEITFDYPTYYQPNDQQVIEYHDRTHLVPISCFGLMDVEVNSIKDWYKLSPHFDPCRNLRAGLQLNDQIEVFIYDKWIKGTIIDIIILNQNNDEPIVEYLEIQTVNDSIIRYNRFDDRVRPLLKTQQIQSKNFETKYTSKILTNIDDNDEKEQLLPPPQSINQIQCPQHLITNQPLNNGNVSNGVHNNNNTNIIAQDPRIQRNGNSHHQSSKYQQEDEEKRETLETVGQNDPTPEIIGFDDSSDDGTEQEQVPNNHINQALFDEFDPNNIKVMQQYQKDLKETMETMQKLALRRTVVTDIFRPVHLTCPKHSYRKTLTDDEEINMSVITRNTKYDYVEVKMIDTDNPQLSEMKVYMTPQQLFEHCTTYFHFTEMKPVQQKIPINGNAHHNNDNNRKKKPIIHNIPPSISMSPSPPINYPSQHIHEYMRGKDSSLSPQRRLHNLSISHKSPEVNIDDNPRSHLQDDSLQSFLHDVGNDNNNETHQDDQKGDWTHLRFAKSSEPNEIDNDQTISAQQFIDKSWNPRPDRMGLGLEAGSGDDSIAHAMGASMNVSSNTSFDNKVNDSNIKSNNDSSLLFPAWNTSKNTSNHSSPSITSAGNLSDQNIRIHNQLNNEEPATPKMASSTSSDEENRNIEKIEINKQSATDNDEDEDEDEDEDDEDESIGNGDDNDMLIPSMHTKGMDLTEDMDNAVNDNNNDTIDDKMENNSNRSRHSVERIIVPPSKVKPDWNKIDENEEYDEAEFKYFQNDANDANDDTMDDGMDDDMNNIHNEVNVRRVYTTLPYNSCLFIILPIMIVIISLSFQNVQQYLPQQCDGLIKQYNDLLQRLMKFILELDLFKF